MLLFSFHWVVLWHREWNRNHGKVRLKTTTEPKTSYLSYLPSSSWRGRSEASWGSKMRIFLSAYLVLTSIATSGLGRSIESIGENICPSKIFVFVLGENRKKYWCRFYRHRHRYHRRRYRLRWFLVATAVTEMMLIAHSIQIFRIGVRCEEIILPPKKISLL